MKWSRAVRRTVLRCRSGRDEYGRGAGLHGRARVVLAALERSDTFVADSLALAIRSTRGEAGRGPESMRSSPRRLPVAGRRGPESHSQTGLRQLLVMPVADRCNLRCRYCYEAERRRRDEPRRMRLELFDRVLQNVLPHVARPFDIAFHGGEPLLAGKEWFAAALQQIRSMPGGEDVVPIVQTNGTLVDSDWCRLFQTQRVRVGLSLDGPPEVHDEVRVDRHGRGTYSAVERGIGRLQEHGMEFGVIVVVNARQEREGSAARVFDHFMDLCINRFDVHPAYSVSEETRDLNLSPRAYAEFMNSLFDRWLDHGDPDVRIGFIENFFQSMTGQRARACYLSGRCTTILGVDPRGRVIPCTRPFGSQHTFGNLALEPLPDVLASDAFRRFEREEHLGQRAGTRPGALADDDCPWQTHCHGGCPHERVENGGQGVAGRNVYCTCLGGGDGGYPAIFRHMRDRVEKVVSDLQSAPAQLPSGGGV